MGCGTGGPTATLLARQLPADARCAAGGITDTMGDLNGAHQPLPLLDGRYIENHVLASAWGLTSEVINAAPDPASPAALLLTVTRPAPGGQPATSRQLAPQTILLPGTRRPVLVTGICRADARCSS